MPLKTPRFWQQDSLLSRLLMPASCLYLAGHRLKTLLAAKPYQSPIPVLCIGGVVAGGSGKTPTLHAILDLIKNHNLFKRPVILTRGYGGAIKTPVVVDLSRHNYHDVGDEALLHAIQTTTIVSPDRAAGAKRAEQIGADIILMDDGLQNTALTKTAALLVIDAEQGLGNARLLPAGPLREPLRDALKKTDLVVHIGTKISQADMDKPIVPAHLSAKALPDKSCSYFAFAGLGRPEKFRETLMSLGLIISDFAAFPDHHPYSEEEIDSLRRRAQGAVLITTEKDYVRIPPACRSGIEILPVRVEFEDTAPILSLLKGMA